MSTIIVYWALIIANEPGFVGSIHRTHQACHHRVADLKRAGIASDCYPTTHPDVFSAADQLRYLAGLFHDHSN